MKNEFLINKFNTSLFIRRGAMNKLNEVPVYVSLSCNEEKAVLNTHVKGKEHDWSIRHKIFVGAEYEPINAKINLVLMTLKQIEIQLSVSGEKVTSKTIIKEYQERLNNKGVSKEKRKTFLEILKEFIENENQYGAKFQTIKNRKVIYNNILDFLKKEKKQDLKCDDIDLEFINAFNLFMYKSGKSINHINRMVGMIKRVLDFALLKKYINVNRLYSLKLKYEERLNTTCLDKEELSIIYKTKFDTEFQKIVDIFLFMCSTGIDHCDYIRLKSENYYVEKGQHFIKYKRLKSDTLADSVLLPFGILILRKYGNIDNLPKVSLHELNKQIKQLSKIIGVSVRITSKMARKTYANYLVNVICISDESTAYSLGHKTTKHLKHYRTHKKERFFSEMAQKL